MFSLNRILQTSAAVVGGAFMIIGVFVPMLSIPILHDDSYFKLSPAGAIIIVVLSAISVIVAVIGRFRILYVTGLLALGLLIYTYFTVQNRKASAQSGLTEHVINTPLRDLSHGLISSVGLRYGWPMMVVGATLIIAVPLVGSRLSRKKQDT